MKKVLMVKAPGKWEWTDKFEFTGLWRCGRLYEFVETDVEFEVRFKHNFIYRWWHNIPKTQWIESREFQDINVCNKPKPPEQDWDMIL